MADTRYLKKRRQAWYFVIKIPADLQAHFGGKQHITTSLKTRDLTKAQKDRWQPLADWQARFEVIRGNRQWTPAEIEEKALAEYRENLALFDETKMDLDDLDTAISLDGDKIEGGELSDLDHALTRARMAAARGRAEALRGHPYEPPATFGRSPIDLVTLKPVTVKKREAGAPFAETARDYIDEVQRDPRSRLTKQTQGQYETVYRLFDQWAEKPGLNQVDRAKASEFLNIIATLDPNWGRSPATKRRTFGEIVERFGNHATGLSNKTINRYASAMSLVWQWAKRRGAFSGENPWEEQHRSTGEKRKTQKLPFSPEELKTLLAETPKIKPEKQTPESTLPWLCLISAYSGLRLNEICDRKVSDIKKEDGVWFLEVTGAKTEAGDRRVPIHSRLIRAGLLKFAKAHKNEWLFPALKPGGPDDKRSWYISKRFTEYRRGLGVVRLDERTGKDRVDYHSFRRSVIQVLERERLPQSEVAQVVGHERGGITFGTYNPEGLNIEALRDVVESIRYPGIDFKFR